MDYQENERFLYHLMNFKKLVLNNFLMFCPNEEVDQEDVEHRVDTLKNAFFNQAMSISHWNKHRMLEIVVKLDLNAAIVDQGF